jgi:hypothetical protein
LGTGPATRPASASKRRSERAGYNSVALGLLRLDRGEEPMLGLLFGVIAGGLAGYYWHDDIRTYMTSRGPDLRKRARTAWGPSASALAARSSEPARASTPRCARARTGFGRPGPAARTANRRLRSRRWSRQSSASPPTRVRQPGPVVAIDLAGGKRTRQPPSSQPTRQ